ncbi:hypothetical protein C8R45DRAFT_1014594 [Mycena sanguinolenta]|nr:hypothetical protein C8R45DRAFT_1014594 [Mycena sanguinolenta]
MRKSLIFAFVAFATSTAAFDFNASTWIWANQTSGGAASLGECAFRKDFTPPDGKTPNFTDILVTADKSFTFYVNGQELGTGSNYQLPYAFRTPLLASGPNVFAAVASPSTNLTQAPAGLLVAIQVTYTDGSTDTIVSDTTWLALTTVPPGSQNLTFDASTWPAAVAESPYGGSGWGPVVIPTTPPSFVLTNATNWIWTNESPNAYISAPVGPRPFRLTWTAPPGQVARSATIIAAGDDEYVFFVNGNLVAGGYSFALSQQISISLAPTANVVFAANVTNDNGPAGFIAEIQITTTGAAGCTDCGSSSFVITDASWKWTDTVPPGFEAPGFDDSSWSPAVVVVAYPLDWGTLSLIQ